MKDADEQLHLTLSIAEMNQVLEALGNQPYVRVYQLIGKIQQQAETQLSPSGGAARPVPGLAAE
jgi:hypothetical protein